MKKRKKELKNPLERFIKSQKISDFLHGIIPGLATLLYLIIEKTSHGLTPVFNRLSGTFRSIEQQGDKFKQRSSHILRGATNGIKRQVRGINKPQFWYQLGRTGKVFFLIVLVILAIVVTTPKGTSIKGNLLNLTSESRGLAGKDAYIASSVSRYVSRFSISEESNAYQEEPLKTMSGTFSYKDNRELASEYEQFSASVSESLKNTVTSSTRTSESTQTTSQSEEGNRTYIVQYGDNPYRIAVNNGMTLDELMALNGMSSPNVVPGQELKLK